MVHFLQQLLARQRDRVFVLFKFNNSNADTFGTLQHKRFPEKLGVSPLASLFLME